VGGVKRGLKVENVFKNRAALEATGEAPLRRIVLDIAESTLRALDARRIIQGLLRLEGDLLRIGERAWDLTTKRRLLVVGAGKAGNAMARGVEDVLGDRVTQGLVIVKQREPGDDLARIELVTGGHPLPNQDGLAASRRLLELAHRATPDDLFISVISGGSSALMNCPLPGISLEDERQTTEALLKSGARILEINAVRRHISATNGGRLAKVVEDHGAEMINLIISDSLGARATVDPAQPVSHYGTPVAPDGTTLDDARMTLQKYELDERVPPAVAEFLRAAGPADETPKGFGKHVHHYVLERPANACDAARGAAAARGLASCTLTTVLEGESSAAGTFLACVAKEVALNGRPVPGPCLLIAGGETTTRIDGPCGQGGPSQELALGFALEVADRRGLCLCALDTDGSDGPTEFAGGLVDGTSVERARAKGWDAGQSLAAHDSSSILRAAGDAILTGNTGTNLCDLNLIYIERPPRCQATPL
jgi:glycerate 2-kinase